MAEVPLSWKLSIQGAEDVQRQLNNINLAFSRGQITASQAAHSQRILERDTKNFTRSLSLQKNLFLAMHPAINTASKALEMFGRISRTALIAITALNVASLVNQGISGSMARNLNDIAKKRREIADLERQGKKGTEEWENAMGDLNAMLHENAEIIERETKQAWSNFVNVIASVGSVASGIATSLIAIGAQVGAVDVIGAIGRFVGLFANPALAQGPAFFFAPFLDLIPGMKDLKKGFAEWLHSWAELDGTFLDTAMSEFFQDIPGAVSEAATFLITGFTDAWNGIIDLTQEAINGMLKGIEGFVNSAIDLFNSLINQLNKIPYVNIPLIQKLAIQPVDLSGAKIKAGDSGGGGGVGVGSGIAGNLETQQRLISSAANPQVAATNMAKLAAEIKSLSKILEVQGPATPALASAQELAMQKIAENQKQGSQIFQASGGQRRIQDIDTMLASLQTQIDDYTRKNIDGGFRSVLQSLIGSKDRLTQERGNLATFGGFSSGGNITVQITNAGSLITQSEINKQIDDALKSSMKRVGFN